MSDCKLLYLWVEGNDDERFLSKTLIPKFQEKFDVVKIIKYSAMRKEKVDNFIKSIKSMGANYIYLTDINYSPCITAKKGDVKRKYKNIDIDKIVIVVREIESWYLAGLDIMACNKLRISTFSNTNDVSKEEFNNLIPKEFTSRIDFMLEILKNFSIEIAKHKNTSFQYFLNKFDP